MIRSGAINWGSPINRGCGLNAGLKLRLIARAGIAGNTFYDLSGNNYHGTLTNSPTWAVSSLPGWRNVINFAASTDYVDLATFDTVSNFAGVGTISFWIKPSLSSNSNVVWDGASFYRAFCVTLLTTGIFRIWWGDVNRADSTTALTANAWSHVTVVRSGVAGAWAISFYINGVLSNTVSSIAANPSPSTSHPLSIGKNYNFYVSPTGPMNDIAIWNRDLAAGEVFNWYSDSSAGAMLTLNRIERRWGYAAAAPSGLVFNPLYGPLAMGVGAAA